MSQKGNSAYYCQAFSSLRVDSSKKRGKAPHQPILLLSVIDLMGQGLIESNQITVSDELIDTFNKYWNILASGSSNDRELYCPFIYLQSKGFWNIQFKPEFTKELLESLKSKEFWYRRFKPELIKKVIDSISNSFPEIRNNIRPKIFNELIKNDDKLKEAVRYAYLEKELFDLLQDQISRQELIDTLIAAWFSTNKKTIEDILQINQSFLDLTQIESNLQSDEPKIVLRKSVVRKAIFRKAIVEIYDYRCAFCRLKVIRSLTQNIVDGAHIKDFSVFYDSNIDNGISLCKNHHWAFDHGWFCIDDNDFKIIVASDLQEESPNARPMKEFHGETILLPSSEKYFPRREALRWHRQKWLGA